MWRLPTPCLLAAFVVAVAVLASLLAPQRAAAQPRAFSLKDDGGETQILADRIHQVGGATNLLVAVGNVEITRGTSRLLADRVELNQDTGEAIAQGKVVFFDGQDRLVGDRVDYNLKTGTGVVYNGSAFSAPHFRLSGERMDRVGEGLYEIQRGVFTTCEGDSPAWSFRVGSATADLDSLVYGTNASFWVGKIPLIPYIPFFAAALRRERQSGFLFPTLGVSSTKGAFASIPYFWAISDSQDLTLSLDVFTRRGVGLEAEYRYILSERARGAASGFFIHEALLGSARRQEIEEDRLRDQPQRTSAGTEENRGFFGLKHDWQITPRLTFKADVNLTSDDFVYRDYGDRLHDRSLQRTESNVSLSQRWDAWSLVGNLLWYQDLTTDQSVELQRLPEIRLHGVRQPIPGLPALFYEVEASYTQFVRQLGPEGPRLDLHPRVFLPLPIGVITVTPFLGGRATYYDQRVVGQRSIAKGTLTIEESVREDRLRAQAEAGLEAETRASRVFLLDGAAGLSALQHVVEPRVTYTEIRGVNQKALPQYDPSIDRIGKVSQVEYSLTNRLDARTVAGPDQEPIRWEMMRLVLSQIYNLLPAADEPFEDLRSDLILQPTRFLRFRGDAAYNVHGLGLRSGNTDLSATYRDVSLSVGTRYSEITNVNFFNATVAARLASFIDARASANWDLRTGAKVETRVGVDVRFQCWAIMLEYIDRHQNEDEVRFSVNLLGIGQVGSKTGLGLQ